MDAGQLLSVWTSHRCETQTLLWLHRRAESLAKGYPELLSQRKPTEIPNTDKTNIWSHVSPWHLTHTGLPTGSHLLNTGCATDKMKSRATILKSEFWGYTLCSAFDGMDADIEKAPIGVSGRGFEDSAGHLGDGKGVAPQWSGWDHSTSGFSKRSLFAGIGRWVTPNSECIWGQEIKLININWFS